MPEPPDPLNRTPRSRLATLRRVLTYTVLGALTTIAVAWSSAFFNADVRTTNMPTWLLWGHVASDGDHVQPWRLQVCSPWHTRTVYFEKGRIYSIPNAGPPGGSSASVDGWSFATATRNMPERFDKRELTFTPDIQSRIDTTPWEVWSAAQEHRGFPFPALRSTIFGTLDKQSPTIFVSPDSILLDRRADNTVRSAPDSILTIRALSYRPLWPGFLANTLIYALLWAALIAAAAFLFGTVTGRRALAQGRCPKCGYDLLGDHAGGCPECGWNKAVIAEKPASESTTDPALRP